MKVAILAGGKGTRLAEETYVRPKPMVEIGGMPIMWHIMMHYLSYGFDEFVVALGYKGEYIKRYMVDHCSLSGNLTVHLGRGNERVVEQHGAQPQKWSADLIETGIDTLTAGRIKKMAPYLGNSTFMLTYGDGISNVNLTHLLEFHRAHGKLCTVTIVRPPTRYGHMTFDGDTVVSFEEKPQAAEGWINGGFFVMEPGVIDYIDGDGDNLMWEKAPLERLAKDGQLMAFRHEDFWSCMDTIRDKQRLQEMWDSDDRPWVTWDT